MEISSIIILGLETRFMIGTKRLVLNTVDKEDAAYYGTFIDGNATITGPANGLFIRVVAQSEGY
jgi:hypothetical protein